MEEMQNSTENIENISSETSKTETTEAEAEAETETEIAQTDDQEQQQQQNDDDVKYPTATKYNPSISEDDLKTEDLEKMKGDAIGNTLYSERFVLSTLLKLSKIEKDLNDDEEFEKELCSLWDMTVEKDVVKLLLQHKVLELFSGIIRSTEDKRLTEILVGIIGNMCNLNETRDELCVNPDIIAPIIDLISCTDTLTLVQLMRLFHAALVFDNVGDETMWFQHFKNSDNFIENFAFILINSMNSTLLVNAFEALNAICAKFAVIELQPDVDEFNFCDLLVQPTLVMGVIEAFKTLLPQENNDKDTNSSSDDQIDTPTQNSQKIMSLFLDIHVFLSQYGETSKKCYQPIMKDLLKCISQTLSPLCQPICLLPLTFNEQGIVENVNELFQAIGDPFDEICFAQMITIWNLIDTNRESKETNNQNQKWDDDDELDEEVNSEDICMTILEFLTRTVRNATDERLKNSLSLHSPRTIMKLLSALSAGDSEPDIKECCHKIKTIFEKIRSQEDTVNQNHNGVV